MTRFEDRLELELEAVVAENAPGEPARRRPWLGWKPYLALAGLVTVGATAIAVTGMIHPTTPAWAIEKTGEGTVRITFNELEDAAGLEKALTKLGIRSEVSFVPPGHSCAIGTPGYQAGDDEPVVPIYNEGSAIELRYGPQEADETFVLTVTRQDLDHGTIAIVRPSSGSKTPTSEGASVWTIAAANAVGPVTPCELSDGSLKTVVRESASAERK